MDEDGIVGLKTVANVAHRARVSLEDAETAIKVLESPEPETANDEDDGRRIERIPDGWLVINAKKYKDMITREVQREQTRIRVARHRARKRAAANGHDTTEPAPTASNADVTKANEKLTPSETDTEAETNTEASKIGSPAPAAPTTPVRSANADPTERPLAIPLQVVERVFEHWKLAWEHPRSKLDDKRKVVIRKALRLYGEADVCRAITGYLNSPYHCGDNDRQTIYDSIELLLRDPKHIDAGLKFYAKPPTSLRFSDLTRRNIAAVHDWKPPELRREESGGA